VGGPSSDLRDALRLMVITDRGLAGDRGWLAVVEEALAAGATSIQLRDKEATSGELFEMARALRPLVLGDDDLPVSTVRRVVPRDFIIGRSADAEDAARAAEADGADYLGVGSVFGTSTKKEVIGEVIGTEQLGRVARTVAIPVVGIGGVTAENAASVVAAGAAGIAVVSAVMGAEQPGAVVGGILGKLEIG
jgi:thiamine monophosphate synthase